MLRVPRRFPRLTANVLGAILFACSIGIAAAIAYQAVSAASSHRKAVEASLEHHATIAAWRFSQEARNWIGYGMTQAGGQLRQELSRHPSLPGPGILQKVLAEKECDCMTAGFGRSFFRIAEQRPDTLVVTGEILSARSRDALIIAAARMMADTVRRQGRGLWRILPPGEPGLARRDDVVLLWNFPGAPGPSGRVVYGMIVEGAQIRRPMREALKSTQFFPPSLISSRGADSLVRIAAAGPTGPPIFSSGPAAATYAGTDTLGVHYGELVITAAISSKAAGFLMDNALPTSRAPQILGLLIVAVMVGALALLIARREHRLIALREDFVSSVSHELRTPLTQIRMLSELLHSGGFRTKGERVRATNIIRREAFRLSGLVDNILEFARLRRAVPRGPAARLCLSDVIRELAESFTPLLDATRSRIEIVIEEELEVVGDRDAVSRVLRNLVENAIKYGPRGQTILVTVGRGEVRDTALVSVDDQGPGIPLSARELVFEPYHRLERDRHAPAGGTGIGLSVVAELMAVLNGRAWVTDAPARGARFVVEFPAQSDLEAGDR